MLAIGNHPQFYHFYGSYNRQSIWATYDIEKTTLLGMFYFYDMSIYGMCV